jgi:hypothetical protein
MSRRLQSPRCDARTHQIRTDTYLIRIWERERLWSEGVHLQVIEHARAQEEDKASDGSALRIHDQRINRRQFLRAKTRRPGSQSSGMLEPDRSAAAHAARVSRQGIDLPSQSIKPDKIFREQPIKESTLQWG